MTASYGPTGGQRQDGQLTTLPDRSIQSLLLAHEAAPLALSADERVPKGYVDGLGVDGADELVEPVQPGEEVGLAPKDR